MKKHMSDAELKRVMGEIAELFPEIDPGDDQWREFMRDFIAARPDVVIDETFSRVLRAEILLRAGEMSMSSSRWKRWMGMCGMFVAGVAVSAIVVLPMTSFNFEEANEIGHERVMLGGAMPEMAMMKTSEHLDVSAGTLNSRMGGAEMAMMAEPMMYDGGLALDGEDLMVNSEIPQLSWDEMPSDGEILAVAIEFFDDRGFDSGDFDEPVIEKWWEMRDEDDLNGFDIDRPEFAPDRLGVVFTGRNGGEIRIDVGMKDLNVLWMSYSAW